MKFQVTNVQGTIAYDSTDSSQLKPGIGRVRLVKENGRWKVLARAEGEAEFKASCLYAPMRLDQAVEIADWAYGD